jgi:hypothetical protein
MNFNVWMGAQMEKKYEKRERALKRNVSRKESDLEHTWEFHHSKYSMGCSPFLQDDYQLHY